MVRASASWSRLGSRSIDWSWRKMRRFLIEPPPARAGFSRPRSSSAETPDPLAGFETDQEPDQSSLSRETTQPPG